MKSPLPANNISQQLFYKQLPNCQKPYGENGSSFTPAPCCMRDIQLNDYYRKAPVNLWNSATNYQGGPGFSRCTDDALLKQCFLSQYYTYLSKNNLVPSPSNK